MKDIGSERAILAGLLQHGIDAYFDIEDILTTECFSTDINKVIYQCLEQIFKTETKIVDVPILYSTAHTLGHSALIVDSTESQKFIRSLYNFPILKESIRTLAEKIVILYVARKAQSLHKNAFDKLEDINPEDGLESILKTSEEPYFNLLTTLTQTSDIAPAGDSIDAYVDSLMENPTPNIGIPTPFPIYNHVIGGGLRKGVHLIAARFKVGKSSIGKETSIHSALNLQIPTLYIDTEMSKEEQDSRILAGLSLVPINEIENGMFSKDPNKKERVLIAKEQYKKGKFFHKNVAGMDFPSILNQMKRWIHKYVGFTNGQTNPHLIIYDYFKLMETATLKNMQEYQAMGFQIAALHDFCQKYNTPVLSFVQINRDGVTRDGTDVISQSDRLGWNCFDKNQEFITSEGVKSFNNFKHNDCITVLSHDGSWQKAIVKNYGKGYVNKLTFKKCNHEFSVKCTSNHRWILKNNIITDNIKIGDTLIKQKNSFDFDYDNASFEEQLYWCYGFVYGDGEFNGKRSQVRLCGKDNQYEYRFKNVGFQSSSSLSLKGDIICYTGKYNKTAPNPKIDSPNLIKAFVAGYMQADGIKNYNYGKKFIGIQSSEKDHIDFIRQCFPIAGIYIISEKDLTGQITNFGVRPYTILFITNDKPDGSSTSNTKLINIEKDIEFTDLWCLEVENTNSFVLPNGTPTGNCISLCIYKRKSPEEIAQDGIENGNMKMVPLEGRFMRRLDDGDYINMRFIGELSSIKELKTRNMLQKDNEQNKQC